MPGRWRGHLGQARGLTADRRIHARIAGRPGQPVELAPVYVLLASPEASFITGEVYGVTGGAGIA